MCVANDRPLAHTQAKAEADLQSAQDDLAAARAAGEELSRRVDELQGAAESASARAAAAEAAFEREQHARKTELQQAKDSYDARAKELSEQVRMHAVCLMCCLLRALIFSSMCMHTL